MHTIDVIDSHTGGEPTRTVIAGFPDLGAGTLMEQRERFRRDFDRWRAGIACEPRGSATVVGALLLPPQSADACAGVIFFNNVSYLGMCGHGTIGVVRTLQHLGRIGPGLARRRRRRTCDHQAARGPASVDLGTAFERTDR